MTLAFSTTCAKDGSGKIERLAVVEMVQGDRREIVIERDRLEVLALILGTDSGLVAKITEGGRQSGRRDPKADALGNALNMLAQISAGQQYNTRDYFDRVTELECALDPNIKPGEALRRFTGRATATRD